MPRKQVITNNDHKPTRADILLAAAFPEYSRAALSKLFDQAAITQYGQAIKAGQRLKPNEKFKADISNLQKPAKAIKLPIIYEDHNVIVIDKPTGVISHARGRYWDEASVASFIRNKTAGLDGERAGIVHRLDRATSGVMICAKNKDSLKYLQRQFANKKTKKIYLAVVNNNIDPPEAVIDIPIARNPKKPNTFRPDASGKTAITAYKVIKSNHKYALLELQPATGRTHQLRVHLQYIKHPVVGDQLYGGEIADRLFLHANSLEISLPNGERRIFTSPASKAFASRLSS